VNQNSRSEVTELYIKKDTLSTRANLHDKYSSNKYGWFNWVFDQLQLKENMNVLELGCGTGRIWEEHEKLLPGNIKIVLTDLSPLMIEKTKEKFKGYDNFCFKAADIENIPFEDEKFDIVMANHMLYHVPDIKKALSEVSRVLKKDGCFYASTVGENSRKELEDIYSNYADKANFSFSKDLSFTLENGEEILRKFFGKIEQRFYIDALEVTSADDLMNYIISYNDIPPAIYDEIYKTIKDRINKDGVFKIRKDQGMFICVRKSHL